MRIVHIIDSSGYYGAEVMLLTLCLAQKRSRINVEVISIGSPGKYEKAIEAKLREHGIPCKIWRMAPMPDLRESRKIIKWCTSTGTDLIHSHGYKGNILLGLLPKKFRTLPVISTLHGYTSTSGFGLLNLKYWLDRKCLKRLDAIVLVSNGMKHQINMQSLGSKVHVIPNGIPVVNSSDSTDLPDALRQPGPIIAAIGRLSKEKNFVLLVNSMTRVLKSFPGARLVIFGEGTERKNLEALIVTKGLSEVVMLPGYISDPGVVYQNADIFVNCSLHEGMPITLLEAMRAGCPIVATDIPANKALFEGMDCSPPFSGFHEDSLANAIIGLLRLNDNEKEKNKNCKIRHFQNHFTDDIMTQSYSNLYKLILENKSGDNQPQHA